jgi:ribosome-associated protein
MAETDRVVRATSFAEAALDKKAQKLVALDVRELTSVADTYLLLTGTSDRHTRSIADAWVLIDLGDVIVHVFQAEVRELYDIERLFSDAPSLDLGAAA